MKLQAKHSKKYLAINNNGRAIQNTQGNDWRFISDNSEEIDPKSGEYGRLVLTGSENPISCLQPSSVYPHDGWLLDLSPIQSDNNSQLWRFIFQDEDGFYVIENKNERREDGKNIKISQACIDVCEAKKGDNIMIITYHVNGGKGSDNQRWRII